MQHISKPLLFLDHFYRVVPAAAFEEAKEIVRIFPNSDYRKTETNHGAYEGAYIFASSGVYIEILKEDLNLNPKSVALCVSQFGEEHDLHRQITEAFPDHTFSFYEIHRSNGAPWMYCTMAESDSERIYCFAIEYREAERQKRIEKGRSPDNWLTSVDRLEITADQSQLERIDALSNWFGTTTQTTSSSVEIRVPQKIGTPFCTVLSKPQLDSRPFRICGSYDETLYSKCYEALVPMKYFQLEFKKGRYALEFKG